MSGREPNEREVNCERLYKLTGAMEELASKFPRDGHDRAHISREQRDAARKMVEQFHKQTGQLIPGLVLGASELVFDDDGLTNRQALLQTLNRLGPMLDDRSDLLFRGAKTANLAELAEALGALDLGETLPLLARSKLSGRSKQNYKLLKLKLLALCWQDALSGAINVRKAATQDVCKAFGVTPQGLGKWRKQCCDGLGRDLVESHLSFARWQGESTNDGFRQNSYFADLGLNESRPPKGVWHWALNEDGTAYQNLEKSS